MCYLDDTFHTLCGHWGPKTVSSKCPGGETDSSSPETGCWNSQVTGSRNVDRLCPACAYRERVSGEVLRFGYEEDADNVFFSSPVNTSVFQEQSVLVTRALRGSRNILHSWDNITRRGLGHKFPDPLTGEGGQLGSWEGKAKRAIRKENERTVIEKIHLENQRRNAFINEEKERRGKEREKMEKEESDGVQRGQKEEGNTETKYKEEDV